jgi:hypothetical protein
MFILMLKGCLEAKKIFWKVSLTTIPYTMLVMGSNQMDLQEQDQVRFE